MRKLALVFLCCLAAAGLPAVSQAQKIEYVTAPPLSQVVKQPVASCPVFKTIPVPVIAWGGDMATLHANGDARPTAPNSIFAREKLDLELKPQDVLQRQVEDYLACKSPYLRGTLDMLTSAADVTEKDPRTKMVLIYKMTDSNGGDAFVVKDSVKTPAGMCGKTIVVQAYGPHLGYLARVVADACGSMDKIKIKYVRDMVEKNKSDMTPAKAFRFDPDVAAAFMITPDAMALTSQGPVGTGAEDSVKGARIMLTTKTANRVIADLYAVRTDYFDANRDKVLAFVHGLMLANEDAHQLVHDKDQRKVEYERFRTISAEVLLGSAQALDDAAGMYGDAEFVGWGGNIRFFADLNYPRRLEVLMAELNPALKQLGLIVAPVSLRAAQWDYELLKVGLKDTSGVEAPRFNRQAVETLVRDRQQRDAMAEGRLFNFPVYFKANATNFPAEAYQSEFDRVIDLVSTYGGALLTIEGNYDTQEYLRRKVTAQKCEKDFSGPAVDECKTKAGATMEVLSRVKQSAKNTTLMRANGLRDAIIAYAKGKGVSLDPNQFVTVGNGFMKPNVAGCTYDRDGDITFPGCYPQSQENLDRMKRAELSLVSVEAESSVFVPLELPVAAKR